MHVQGQKLAQGLVRALPFLVAWKLWRQYRDRSENQAESRFQLRPLASISGGNVPVDPATCRAWRALHPFLSSEAYCEAWGGPEVVLEDVAQMGDRFVMKRILKRGESTRVYECADTTLKKQVAVKIVDNAGNAPSVSSLQKEVDLVLSFINEGNGEYFVPIHYFDGKGDSNVLAMDLCTADLCDKMTEAFCSPDEAFSTLMIRRLMFRMLQCLDCLHSRNIAHLDLKPDNFVFGTKTGTPLSLDDIQALKLIDLSGVTDNDQAGKLNEVMTTLYYAAPELLKSQETDLLACDVWAMGVIFFVLLSQGSYPLTERDIYDGDIFSDGGVELRRRIEEVEAPAEAKNLLASMLALDEKDRPTLREMTNHSFFRSHDDVKLHKTRLRGTFGRAAKVDRRLLMPYKCPRANIINVKSSVEVQQREETATSNEPPNSPGRRRRAGVIIDTSESIKMEVFRRKSTRNKRQNLPLHEYRKTATQRKRKKETEPLVGIPTRRRSMSTGSLQLTHHFMTTQIVAPERASTKDPAESLTQERRSSDGPTEMASLRRKSLFLHRMANMAQTSGYESDSSSSSSSSTSTSTSSGSVSFNYDNPLLVNPWERIAKQEADARLERTRMEFEKTHCEGRSEHTSDTETDNHSGIYGLHAYSRSLLSSHLASFCTDTSVSPAWNNILAEIPLFGMIQ